MAGHLISSPRDIPSVEELLQAPQLADSLRALPRIIVTDAVRDAVAEVKTQIKNKSNKLTLDDLFRSAVQRLEEHRAKRISRVINATGIVVHTNLGRAPVAQELFERIKETVTGYGNIEFDVTLGKRGHRGEICESYLSLLSGAESGTVVNNCAAALLVCLNTLAKGKKVLISRGELVQIGGGFRIPDILRSSGAKLAEVGTTNITTLDDYEQAIDDKTALILKVHRSNFTQAGFTDDPSLKQLVKLARNHEIPLLNDLGSGVFIPTRPILGYSEPTVQESVRDGADLTCFSGDKMLGGLQAGLVVGKQTLVSRIKKNPVFRALRVDKIVFSALEQLLHTYLDKTHDDDIPVWRILGTSTKELRIRAQTIFKGLKKPDSIKIEKVESYVGGGALPEQAIESVGLVFDPSYNPNRMLRSFRSWTTPIIGRIENDRLILDLRTVDPADFPTVVKAINSLTKSG